jgi:hypothetical protein
MPELARYLFLAGALPFLLLGIAHAFATPLAVGDRKGLSPDDPSLAQAMAHTRLRLTRRTDMWLGWVGFNLSHSLGAIAFAVFVLIFGRDPASFAADAALALPVAWLVSACYLALAVKYWFRTPILGCAFSFGSFSAAWLLRSLS